MAKREYLLRYIKVINKLRSCKEATFNEISDYLKSESELHEYDLNISQRTFQRDLNEVRSLFNIDIQFDFSKKVYYIVEEIDNDELSNKMLEAFNIYNSLKMAGKLKPFIHFEKRQPQGTEHMSGFIYAIQNNKVAKFKHKKFWDDEETTRTVEPYALKECQNRWYIVAKDRKDGHTKTFGLDRISELEILKQKFSIPKDFNINEMFKYSFGIISPSDVEAQEITLSFEPIQGKYIKTFPLHESQMITKDNKDEFEIKLKLKITNDFVMELLKYGSTIEIKSPVKLKKEVCGIYNKALKQY
jgi:predicted DNA-binding transcriptional regulator YafY